jgi:hypothetical protein
MTITDATTTTDAFQLVALDLYKDIHKGIRSELFAVTTSAGCADPADPAATADVAAHVRSVVDLLESHAEHEDRVIQPAIELHLPPVAERIASDHAAFDVRTARLVDLAADVAATSDARLAHLLYLDLAAFTGDYLAHQDVEERILMPALERAVGFEACLAMHQAIVGSIPPDEMARSLALMLPAMNVDDRTALLGGMQAGAPPEVFQGVWSLVGSVLEPADVAAVAVRLGL